MLGLKIGSEGALVPVRVSFGVEWTHVINFLEIDVREHKFVVAGVYDSGSI